MARERAGFSLEKEERILCSARLHWAAFLGPLMVLVIGLFSIGTRGMTGGVICLLGLLWGVVTYFSYLSSALTLTNRRVIVHMGALLRKRYDIPLETITLVDTYQPSLGAMLNFGKVIIGHGKKARSSFRMVAAPIEFVMELKREVGKLYDTGNPPAA